MDLGLGGKSAIVFGASKGIGAAAARALAGEGTRLALVSRSGGTAGIAGIAGTGIAADLTQTGDANRAVAEALAALGTIDLAVISVGAAQGGSFVDLADQVWEDALALKFMGMVRALRALIPPMRANGGGRIVVVVGNNGRQPSKSLLPGSAANAACLAVIRGLADDVAADGIRINALNPGPTRTDRWSTMIDRLATNSGRDPAAVEQEMLAIQPLGRIAEADEMGRLAAMLLSDAADMLVGTSLTADGGATKVIG
jgi:3-oxoacyl-[acyl-carrier protein] reductase